MPSAEAQPLTHKCGIVAIYGENAPIRAKKGINALSHRGQDRWHMTVDLHDRVGAHGAPRSEFDYTLLPSGIIAVAHNRYATNNNGNGHHNQPYEGRTTRTVHNGTLSDTRELDAFLITNGYDITNWDDSERAAQAIDHFHTHGASLPKAVDLAYPMLIGGLSIISTDGETLIGATGGRKLRPLIGGGRGGEYGLASESVALDAMQLEGRDEVSAGSMRIIDADGVRDWQLAAEPRLCIDAFEYGYFADNDSIIEGQRVVDVRYAMGQSLWYSLTPDLDLDIIVPVLSTGEHYARGVAAAAGLPYVEGLQRNPKSMRTFIDAQPDKRKLVQGKFTALPEELAGWRVGLIDDSIVRGNTSGPIIDIVRAAGAKEVHFLSGLPPVLYTDHYGIDIATREQLFAYRMQQRGLNHQQIADQIGADSLHYLPVPAMIDAIDLGADQIYTGVFTGDYPVSVAPRIPQSEPAPLEPKYFAFPNQTMYRAAA